MSRMSELHVEIQDMLSAGMTPAFIAKDLKIPLHWVTEIAEEQEYQDYMAAAEQYADADAFAYGMK